MYRVLTIVGGGLLLAACSSSSDWFNNAIKPSPVTDTVQFESEPAGAEAKTSTGHTCRTPCSLALSADAPFSVTFTLNGYLPETEQVDVISDSSGARLRPNPVLVELSAAPAGAKKPAPKKPAKPRKKPVASAKPAAASQANSPAAAPWPAPKQ